MSLGLVHFSPRTAADGKTLKERIGAYLDAAEEEKNDDDEQNQAHSSRRGVAPFPAMRPPGQCTEQRQHQYYDQYSSEHYSLHFT